MKKAFRKVPLTKPRRRLAPLGGFSLFDPLYFSSSSRSPHADKMLSTPPSRFNNSL